MKPIGLQCANIAIMQSNRGISKEWANSVLQNGYQSDNKEPNKTKAKIWNQKAAVFETIEFDLGLTKAKVGTVRWNGRKVKK